MGRFQQTLASQASFAKHGRKSKRELFLDQMNLVVPWSELLALALPMQNHAPAQRFLKNKSKNFHLRKKQKLSELPGPPHAFSHAKPVS